MSKILKILFVLSLWNPGSAIAEELSQPPMPDYMKKAGFKPVAPPAKSKAQPQLELDPRPPIPGQKFLRGDSEKPKVLQKHKVTQNREKIETVDLPSPPLPPVQVVDKAPTPPPVDPETQKLLEQAQMEDLDIDSEDMESPELDEQNVTQDDVRNQFLQAVEDQGTKDSLTQTDEVEEEDLETLGQLAEVALAPQSRRPSNSAPFKAGLHAFAKACNMHESPDKASGKQGLVSQGKKLWVDPHNESWHKVYKKSGTVYVSVDCL